MYTVYVVASAISSVKEEFSCKRCGNEKDSQAVAALQRKEYNHCPCVSATTSFSKTLEQSRIILAT